MLCKIYLLFISFIYRWNTKIDKNVSASSSTNSSSTVAEVCTIV